MGSFESTATGRDSGDSVYQLGFVVVVVVAAKAVVMVALGLKVELKLEFGLEVCGSSTPPLPLGHARERS